MFTFRANNQQKPKEKPTKQPKYTEESKNYKKTARFILLPRNTFRNTPFFMIMHP